MTEPQYPELSVSSWKIRLSQTIGEGQRLSLFPHTKRHQHTPEFINELKLADYNHMEPTNYHKYRNGLCVTFFQ